MKPVSFKKVVIKPKITQKKINQVKKIVKSVIYNRQKLPKGWKKL